MSTTHLPDHRCHFCGQVYDRGISAPHWTGTEYVRINVCAAPACRDQIAAAPRCPRRPRRQPIAPAGDGGWSDVARLGAALNRRTAR